MEIESIKGLFSNSLDKLTAPYPKSVNWGLAEIAMHSGIFVAKAWVTVPQNMDPDKLSGLLSDIAQVRDTMQDSLAVGGIQAILTIEHRVALPDPELEPIIVEQIPEYQKYAPKRSTEIEDRLLELIQEIGHKTIACKAAGIVPSTLNLWEKYDPEFHAKVEMALGKFQAKTLLKILEAGEKYFQANAWVLEEMYPQEFAKHTVQDIRDWSDEELDAYVAKADANAGERAKDRSTKKSAKATAEENEVDNYLEIH